MTPASIGVGLIGAGLVAQAIHAPVLRRLSTRLALRAVWDVDEARAEALAAQEGASATADLDALLADPAVDVVAICTPSRLHIEHAVAAMRAGKRAVLVEKPVCASVAEAETLAQVAYETGAVVVAGSMHLHDPAWAWAGRIVAEHGFAASSVGSRIVLPPNSRFEKWAFEWAASGAPAATGDAPRFTPVDLMRLAVMELAIHDLPLLRRLLPTGAAPRVRAARLLEPFGYVLAVEAGNVPVDLFGLAHGHGHTEWTIEAVGTDARLSLAFTPSFVHAGSARVAWHAHGETRTLAAAADNGYFHEWLLLADAVAGVVPRPDPKAIVEDYRFACAIADQACALIESGEMRA